MEIELYRRTTINSMYVPFIAICDDPEIAISILLSGAMIPTPATALMPDILLHMYMPSNWLELVVLAGVSRDQVESKFKSYKEEKDESTKDNNRRGRSGIR